MFKISDTISASCSYYIHCTILKINTPTKTRDFKVLLYIKGILNDKEMVMKITDQDLHQMFNVTSIS